MIFHGEKTPPPRTDGAGQSGPGSARRPAGRTAPLGADRRLPAAHGKPQGHPVLRDGGDLRQRRSLSGADPRGGAGPEGHDGVGAAGLRADHGGYAGIGATYADCDEFAAGDGDGDRPGTISGTADQSVRAAGDHLLGDVVVGGHSGANDDSAGLRQTAGAAGGAGGLSAGVGGAPGLAPVSKPLPPAVCLFAGPGPVRDGGIFPVPLHFGDTGRVPYGSRSNDTIKKYALQDANFLLQHNVKMVIAACGTVSSVAGDLLRTQGYPYTGVVNPTVYTAVRTTKNKRVGVIGTSATIGSHSYKKRLTDEDPEIKVFEQDCPLFVPLVENGFIDKNDPIVHLTVERYLASLKENNVDTLILGGTHYPILREVIAEVMGDSVSLIDSGMETAYYAKKVLKRENLLAPETQVGKNEFYVSDTPDNFEKVAEIFLGQNIDHYVKQINIEEY